MRVEEEVPSPVAATQVETRRVGLEFSRYFCAGLLAFGADFLVLLILTEYAGLHYLLSNIFGFAIGLSVSYLLCIRWVFSVRRLTSGTNEFGLFTLLSLVGLGLNEGVMWCAVEFASAHYLLAKVVATGSVFVVNFLLKKAVLFR